METDDNGQFQLKDERVAYKRCARSAISPYQPVQTTNGSYLSVLDRTIVFPDGRETSWDVAKTSDFVTVVPFHTQDARGVAACSCEELNFMWPQSSITLIKEYCQGGNRMGHALPGGCFEPQKTPTLLAAAKAELSEEARLTGGDWTALLPEGHPGICELKWVANRFFPYLCIDPSVDANPGKRELEEEYIEIERLPTRQIRRMVIEGRLMLATVQSIIMAVDRLKTLGHQVEGWT